MTFTTHDNPYTRREARIVPRRYEEDERVFEETGERRPAKRGEYVLGLFGVAQAKNDTADVYTILREVTRPQIAQDNGRFQGRRSAAAEAPNAAAARPADLAEGGRP